MAGGITTYAQVPSDDGLYTVGITNWTQTGIFSLGLTRCEALADKSPDSLAVPGPREAVLPTDTTSAQWSLRAQPVWGQEQLCQGHSSSSDLRLPAQPLPRDDKAMGTHIFECQNGGELCGDKVLHKLLKRSQNLLNLILCCHYLGCWTNGLCGSQVCMLWAMQGNKTALNA